jgi:hypothetical protein
VRIASPTSSAHIPAGLDRVRDLRQIGAGTISAAPLSVLQHLETLWLAWQGALGTLSDAVALAELPRLARLTLTDAYGIDADTLPDLPALTGLAIHGLRRTAATAIKARRRRTNIHLTITGTKKRHLVGRQPHQPVSGLGRRRPTRRRGSMQGLRCGRSRGGRSAH